MATTEFFSYILEVPFPSKSISLHFLPEFVRDRVSSVNEF